MTAGLVVETGSARGAPLRGAGRLRCRGGASYLALETLVAMHQDLPGALSPDKAVGYTSRPSARA